MELKQTGKDMLGSGTVRLNSLISLIVVVLTQFGVPATAEMVTLGTLLANLVWKGIQKHTKNKNE